MKHINAKYFNTFVAAASTPSFTEASEKCCMSQANVSKQIAALERQVGHKLFDRRKNKPTITNAGKILIEYINGLEHLHVDYVQRLTTRIEELDGLVSYAMPASCLLSPHFPMLMEKRRNYPNLDINLTIESNENVFQMLTKGTVDFGFLTKRISHQRLTSKVFCQEEYVLVGSTAEAVNKISSGKGLIQQRYISYPGMKNYFNMWRKHYFPDHKDINDLSLHYSGKINGIEGAIMMVRGGLGLSVFPRHCISQQLEEGALHLWNNNDPPLMNNIYIVKPTRPELPLRVEVVIDWFQNMVSNDACWEEGETGWSV